jgi:hypothetical protein
MNQTTKTVLIVLGAVVVIGGGYLVYKKYQEKKLLPAQGGSGNGAGTADQVGTYVDAAKDVWDELKNLF